MSLHYAQQTSIDTHQVLKSINRNKD